MHSVVTGRNKTFKADLISDSSILPPGRIVIMAEEQTSESNQEMVYFIPKACFQKDTLVRMENDLCFFIIYRNISPGKYTPIYKSEIKRPDGGRFKWNQVQVGATDLCKDNIENEIKIEFFRSVSSGKHKNLSTVNTITLA